MADAMSTLIWGLHAATGLDVFPATAPETANPPYLTVQGISDPMVDHNHSAGASIHNTRIQVAHVGTYEQARPLVTTVQNYLEGNRVDFLSCISDGIYLESNEAEGLWRLVKGYYIQWRY